MAEHVSKAISKELSKGQISAGETIVLVIAIGGLIYELKTKADLFGIPWWLIALISGGLIVGISVDIKVKLSD